MYTQACLTQNMHVAVMCEKRILYIMAVDVEGRKEHIVIPWRGRGGEEISNKS